ncbi:hypothetical protein HRG_003939 [Hirsutella rhossiliensis]|uniref:Uncharacterized protein n=1 Tax=Hirsutella rhossiliensis TaxID=111463 RepID=A0A9P8N1H1_9HYPO|nr:uncharacterized protein HRG_03939 [Hirsutella rhossiliensis]KAH0965923.1 hypothetical protein HRG_03939 [Hirsutella rhossiliensis]
MKVSTFLVAAASAVSASPVDKRALGGLLMCTGANATGTCKHQVYELNKCVQLEAPFYHNTSTFAPDGESFSCFPRVTNCGAICTSPTGCTFGAVNFTYEHKFDLGAIKWNTLIASFDCLPNRA